MSEEMDHRIERTWWRSRRVVVAGGVIAALLVTGVLAVAWLNGLRSSIRVPAASVTITIDQKAANSTDGATGPVSRSY